MSLKNPTYSIGKQELGELLETYFMRLDLPGYTNFFPDIKTVRVNEGQSGEFQGLTVELKPKL